MRTIWCVGMLLVLAGCSGNGGSSSEPDTGSAVRDTEPRADEAHADPEVSAVDSRSDDDLIDLVERDEGSPSDLGRLDGFPGDGPEVRTGDVSRDSQRDPEDATADVPVPEMGAPADADVVDTGRPDMVGADSAVADLGIADAPGPDGPPLLYPEVTLCSPPFSPDAYTLTAAAVAGDTLRLSVEYSGGCETHDFSLCWDGLWLESFPVQAVLKLTHDGHDDPCDGVINEDRRFDLTFLKESYWSSYGPGAATIIIDIQDTSVGVNYDF